MNNEPCNWDISYVACGDPEQLLSVELSGEERAAVESMATSFLWEWTGRRFGTCEKEIRPCGSTCSHSAPIARPYLHPYLHQGQWFNFTCGSCGVPDSSPCSCGETARTLHLPRPVSGIVEVLEDGAKLPPSAYYLDPGSGRLYRQDGQAWRTCQDLSLSLTEPGTWGVRFLYGIEVPPGGRIAAGVLSLEMMKALCRDSSCQLPERVQSITRQGVSMAILDSFEDLEAGRTGLWLVDSWVSTMNAKPSLPSLVYTPSAPLPQARRLGWR